jgi:hypothetical protein
VQIVGYINTNKDYLHGQKMKFSVITVYGLNVLGFCFRELLGFLFSPSPYWLWVSALLRRMSFVVGANQAERGTGIIISLSFTVNNNV